VKGDGSAGDDLGRLQAGDGMPSDTVTQLGISRRMRGLDRAFEILDFLRATKKPARPNEIAAGIDAPKSTAYELVNLLIKAGALEYADNDGRVFLGRKLYFLGLVYQQQFDLTRECRAFLARVAEETRETAQFCMLDGNKYTVVMMKEGIRPFRISSDVGEPVPVPWTASGRLLVSHMSEAEILAFIPEADFVLPNGARLAPRHFLDEVAGARTERFFSFDSLADNFTHCFAAPVYQGGPVCVATLCLVAPKQDAARNYERYRAVLVETANELSAKLGDTPLRFSGGVA
jgi:DNA-binding IclR family transcriptional regulator